MLGSNKSRLVFLSSANPAAELYRRYRHLDYVQSQRHFAAVKGLAPEYAVEITPEINRRNRYPRIQPFSTRRICLKVAADACDYINASPIVLPHPPSKTAGGQDGHRYIASQGPKADQLAEFWNMVFQETASVGVIVMLTPLVENGFEKCATYFPLSEHAPTLEFDSLTSPDDNTQERDDEGRPSRDTVTLISIAHDDVSHIETRELKLTIGGISKRIWHLYFTRWPDHSTPSIQDADSLRKLIHLSATKAKSSSNPRIVHCSAGVGRTGTFIALAHLLTELEAGRLLRTEDGATTHDLDGDPIYQVANQLREQRMYMVFNEVQYKFLYDFLRQEIPGYIEAKQG